MPTTDRKPYSLVRHRLMPEAVPHRNTTALCLASVNFISTVDTTEKFLRVTTWFGETTIIIPRDLPLTIRANAILGKWLFLMAELNFGDRIFEHQPQGDGRSVVMEISMGFER